MAYFNKETWITSWVAKIATICGFDDFKLTSERTCSSEDERLVVFKTYLTGDARHVYEGFNGNEIDSLEEAENLRRRGRKTCENIEAVLIR